jgi:hypothetical protein
MLKEAPFCDKLILHIAFFYRIGSAQTLESALAGHRGTIISIRCV